MALKFKIGRPRDGEADRRLDSSEGDIGVGAGVATLKNGGGSVLAGDADGVEARWRGGSIPAAGAEPLTKRGSDEARCVRVNNERNGTGLGGNDR